MNPTPSDLLRKCLQQLNCTIECAATKCGVSQATLHKLLTGERRMRVVIARKLEAGIGLDARQALIGQVEIDLAQVPGNSVKQ